MEGDGNGEGLRVGVAVARFNSLVTERLLEGCLAALRRAGVRDDDITVAWVPGSFELPLAAAEMAASGRFDAIVCLGAVLRGETDHYAHVAAAAAQGIAAVATAARLPVAFGVLTAESLQQALERCGGKAGHKGADAAAAAVETARLLQRLRREAAGETARGTAQEGTGAS
ncbi:MAG: 6,7-dimethyl-8-ribityllumazine synthase [Clostridia bacterium]|nr:6,7-dimethyl-8-ribityllumazine synthase [Clostridia bacterium]